ncbi:HAD hydrolase subfamily IA [Trinorchestia longiramus]|nr:HAD hydrolase subfamily IA [Trinorchestia longiramus]
MLRVITFDINNTLLKFTKNPGEVYAQVTAQYGYTCNSTQMSAAFRRAYKGQYVASPTFGSGQEDWTDWWGRVIDNTLKLTELPLKTEHQKAITGELIELYSHSSAYTALPYAKETLQNLKKRTVLIGIISNTDPRIKQVLQEHSFAGHLSFVVDAYTAGFAKPDSRIFEHARCEAGLSNLKAEEVLHVGDSIIKDYLGARRAGLQSMLVTHDYIEQCSQHGVPVDSSSMFPTLRELLPNLLLLC